MVEVWRPAPSKVRIYPGQWWLLLIEFSVENHFSQKKWSTYCKYFSLWQIWGMCGGHTHLITSHQWPSLLAAPSHPTALCVTNDKNTQWTKGLQTLLLREDINRKKTFSFGHCPNEGGGLPLPDFFGPFSRSAFLVNKKSLFLQKCQCIELLTCF